MMLWRKIAMKKMLAFANEYKIKFNIFFLSTVNTSNREHSFYLFSYKIIDLGVAQTIVLREYFILNV